MSTLLPREASESLALRARGLLSPRGANPQQMGWGHADTVRLALQASVACGLHLLLSHACPPLSRASGTPRNTANA